MLTLVSVPEYCKLNLINILYVGSILVWIFIEVDEFYFFFSSRTDLGSNSSQSSWLCRQNDVKSGFSGKTRSLFARE